MEFSVPGLDPIWMASMQVRLEHWMLTEVLTWASVAQLAAILTAALIAVPVGKLLRRGVSPLAERSRHWGTMLAGPVTRLPALSYPAAFWLLILFAAGAAEAYGQPHHFIVIAQSLLSAWLVIQLAASVIANREVSRLVSALAWGIAALNVLGLLQPLTALLDSWAFPLGNRNVSVLDIMQAIVLLTVLLWLAGALGRFIASRLARSTTLTPSIKVLADKSVRVILVAAGFLLTLNYLGIDLTAFAVFTGAVGVGIGFGLQKVISNLISGFILLLDRSIKPGDVVEIGETFGWVTALNARYAALTTRDGREWLIPNEDLITQQVINWSYTTKNLRLPLKFGISYDSDVHKAMALAVEAANGVDRVLKDPKPVCRLTGLGDSSVDFELRVWIDDPEAGVMNVKSDVYVALWDLFHEHGIEFPFPQRDILIKPGSSLTVETKGGE